MKKASSIFHQGKKKKDRIPLTTIQNQYNHGLLEYHQIISTYKLTADPSTFPLWYMIISSVESE